MRMSKMPRFNLISLVNRTGIALLSTSFLMSAVSISARAAIAKPKAQPVPTPSVTATSAPSTLPDGVYLYGESQTPEQLGKGYFVFESKQGKVVGALYMPRSSFDCASGAISGGELALTVTNSYDRTTNPYAIAVSKASTLASNGNPALQQFGLEGFYRLDTLSANDQRMLKTCKADLQAQ